MRINPITAAFQWRRAANQLQLRNGLLPQVTMLINPITAAFRRHRATNQAQLADGATGPITIQSSMRRLAHSLLIHLSIGWFVD